MPPILLGFISVTQAFRLPRLLVKCSRSLNLAFRFLIFAHVVSLSFVLGYPIIISPQPGSCSARQYYRTLLLSLRTAARVQKTAFRTYLISGYGC